jgi:hypothetical protein
MTKSLGTPGQDFPDTEPLTHESEYAETQPQPLAAATPALPDGLSLELAPAEVTLYEVMRIARQDNRVCPQPTKWLELYRILQEHAKGAALPAEPLTGSGWASTPAMAKRQCFHEQLDWADKHHCLRPVHDWLQGLMPSEWHVA